jgi:hypothetical protein
MSAENVELVRRWFKGLEHGELSPEICDPEIVIRNWDESPIRGPYHGHEGRFRLTGIEVDGPFGSIITVRDGKIVSAIGYASPGLAKKAAGLGPPSGPNA